MVLSVQEPIVHRVLSLFGIFFIIELSPGMPAEERQLPRAREVGPLGDDGMHFVPGFSRQLTASPDCFQSVRGTSGSWCSPDCCANPKSPDGVAVLAVASFTLWARPRADRARMTA
jgi:hypothetical protein